VRRDRADAVTSLRPEEADAAALLRPWRGHRRIERLHRARDVLFDEDRPGATVGSVPQALAALHNAAIGLLRAHGRTAIAAARRHLARAPHEPLPLGGDAPTDAAGISFFDGATVPPCSSVIGNTGFTMAAGDVTVR